MSGGQFIDSGSWAACGAKYPTQPNLPETVKQPSIEAGQHHYQVNATDITVSRQYKENRFWSTKPKVKISSSSDIWKPFIDNNDKKITVTCGNKSYTYNFNVEKDCTCFGKKKLVVDFTAALNTPVDKEEKAMYIAIGQTLRKDLTKQLNKNKTNFNNSWDKTETVRNPYFKTSAQLSYLGCKPEDVQSYAYDGEEVRPRSQNTGRLWSVTSGVARGIKEFFCTPSVLLMLTPLFLKHISLYICESTEPSPNDHKIMRFMDDQPRCNIQKINLLPHRQ